MLRFRPCPVDEEPAATLVRGMREEIAALYEGLNLDGLQMPKAGPAELSPPGGTFVVGYDDGVPVCCGGLKRLSDDACEIKRMFVVDSARGRGVARELLAELERRARELDYTVARLDTGPRQPRAQRMYERAGYVAIENFNANPVASFFGEKRLRKRVHLLLGAGGVRCLSYIGALMQLRDEGCEFATVSTASAGTLIGALLCSGVAPEAMEDEVLKMDLARMAGKPRFKRLERVKLNQLWTLRSWPYARYSEPGIADVFSEIATRAGRAPDPTLGDLAVPLSTAAVDVAGKRLLVYSTDSHPDIRVQELLRIAVSIPLLYPPHERERRAVMDVSLASYSPVWLAAGQPEDLPIIVLRTTGPRVCSRRLDRWLGDVAQSGLVSRDTFELERSPRVTVHDIQSDVASTAFDCDVARLIRLGRDTVAESGERRTQRFVGPSDGAEGRAERQAGDLYSRHFDRLARERRPTVFLSYAHEDRDWVRRLRAQLNSLLADTGVDVWDDSYIGAGSYWLGAIEDAIERARVGVLFVSEHFQRSCFIRDEELALLRRASAAGTLRLLWLPIDRTPPPEPERAIQALLNPEQPLTARLEPDADEALATVGGTIERAYREVDAQRLTATPVPRAP